MVILVKKIDDIFYKEIIPEAATGYIDCDFFIPICFGTKELYNNELVDVTVARDFNNAMTPTLLIKDRDLLNSSIEKYVFLARNFYAGDLRLDDVSNKEKYIIACLLSNTLVTDFNDITSLFDRHSNFLMDNSFEKFYSPQNIGYSEKLKANIIVSVDKQSIVEETPYGMNIHLEDDESNVVYDFPTIRFGISDDVAYIYAVQKSSRVENKKIERILRKTGEGFDEQNSERDPVTSPENLYSVSPWALVALSIAIPIIKNSAEVDSFVAPYFLINRWNAVEISNEILKEKYKDRKDTPSIKKLLDGKDEQVSNHDNNQRNITDKFIRNFRRLEHHFDNINIDSFQLEMDSCLHFLVSSECQCNNSLLGDVYTLADSFSKKDLSKKSV